MATTVLDIVRLTPKTNCGQCGYPTCMAFAAAVVTGRAGRGACPHLPEDPSAPEAAGADDPDTALARDLRRRTAGLDLAALAPVVGARYDEEAGTPWLVLPYLGRRIRVGPAGAAADDGRELDPRDQILLHNYLFFCRTGEVEGRWIGLESLPNSISKVTTLRRAAEERLAGAFAGRPGDLAEAASRLGGTVPPACEADLCIEIPVLPRVPLRLQFWDADPEDGFPARVKVLFDGAVDRVLDLESTVFAAERTAEALLDLDPAESAGRRTS